MSAAPMAIPAVAPVDNPEEAGGGLGVGVGLFDVVVGVVGLGAGVVREPNTVPVLSNTVEVYPLI